MEDEGLSELGPKERSVKLKEEEKSSEEAITMK